MGKQQQRVQFNLQDNHTRGNDHISGYLSTFDLSFAIFTLMPYIERPEVLQGTFTF